MSTSIHEDHDLAVDAEFLPTRFTVGEYLNMVAVGAFDEIGRVELLEGHLVKKMTKKPPHAVATGLLADKLNDMIRGTWHISNQDPIQLDDSVPEPDLAVVAGTRREYGDRHPRPTDVALLVEIADSSLRKDRRKAVMYARNHVSVYWIVNLIDEQVEVYEQPEDSGYLSLTTYLRGDAVPCTIEGASLVPVPVDDILP